MIIGLERTTGGNSGLPAPVAAAVGEHWHVLAQSVLAGFYLVLALISPSGMGTGDIKAASLGTLLAWRGWGDLIAGGFAGFLLAAVYGIALLATRKQHIPFGLFMLIGVFAMILAWPG